MLVRQLKLFLREGSSRYQKGENARNGANFTKNIEIARRQPYLGDERARTRMSASAKSWRDLSA